MRKVGCWNPSRDRHISFYQVLTVRYRTLDKRCVWLVLGDDHYKRMPFVTMSHESTLTVQISCAPNTGINLQPFHWQKKKHVWWGQKTIEQKTWKTSFGKSNAHILAFEIDMYIFFNKNQSSRKDKLKNNFYSLILWMKCIHGHYEHPKFILSLQKKLSSFNINIKWCSFEVLFGRETSLGTSFPAGVLDVYL